MGTRKISQLETISDANLSGEAILPLVVSDPLIPNRKAKVNQLFKGVAQGTKSDPGLAFDLDRNTGLYQNAYDQIGIGFGSGGLYMTRIDNGNSSTSLYITAIDDVANNSNIVLSPKGTGSVQVTGQFLIDDGSFILSDSQGPRARFEVSNVGTGTNTRIFTLPAITSGNGTTIVGDDTEQTLRNKSIVIDEDNLSITDGDDAAKFQLAYSDSIGQTRRYFLPDPGITSVTLANSNGLDSTLLDTKASQIAFNKTFVDVKFAADDAVDTNWAQINTSALTADRTITLPDQSLTLVGTESNQVIKNKSYETLVLQDPTDNTKKITFNLQNQTTLSNSFFSFPPTLDLNTVGNTNILVTEAAEQDLTNKTVYDVTLKSAGNTSGQVILSVDNITGPRTIRFPDSNATLLSTENVTLEDVNFGAGIGANNLTGLTRQQQFFYSGF
ncbi:hypothetical protein [Synechococcus phage S-H25]|nr:hypothetical protein [Synechococcus phage S-H25]